jgi:hypothetical protein
MDSNPQRTRLWTLWAPQGALIKQEPAFRKKADSNQFSVVSAFGGWSVARVDEKGEIGEIGEIGETISYYFRSFLN